MIRQAGYFYFSVAMLLLAGWFVVDRLVFLHTAKRTTGAVTRIWGENGNCGGKYSHPCTLFYADVSYTPDGGTRSYSHKLGAGQSYGHNSPVSDARLAPGAPVRVIYNPKNPAEAYTDTVENVWGGPILLFLTYVVSFVTSLTEPGAGYQHAITSSVRARRR